MSLHTPRRMLSGIIGGGSDPVLAGVSFRVYLGKRIIHAGILDTAQYSISFSLVGKVN